MKDETFNWIWRQIELSAESIETEIMKRYSGKESCDFHRTYGGNAEKIIFREYTAIKDRLKARCYENQADAEDRIDHHKIAACCCLALLNKKFFSFKICEDIPQEILLSNYNLAYTASLWIVYFHLVDAYSEAENEELRALALKLIDQGGLCVPKTTSTHDKYNIGRVKMLALNDLYHVEFDLLAYADMMFWVEHYNRQLLEGKVVPAPLY